VRQLAVFVALAGCYYGSEPEAPKRPPAIDCIGAAEAIQRTVEDGNAVASFKLRCERDAWTVAAVECMKGVRTPADRERCAYKHLTRDQSVKLRVATPRPDAMRAMVLLKELMCECRDSTCAVGVSDKMTEWSREQTRKWGKLENLSEEETKEAAAIGEAMGKCMTTAMSASP